MLSSRWPFVWGGLAIGVVESIYYIWYRSPIDITFALAEAASALEDRLGLQQALFNRGYAPGVNGIFMGLIAGGLLAALLQGVRYVNRYSLATLIVAFLGGVLAGLGAVLAKGDTLYHFIGGIAMLQTSSLFMTAFAIPFVFLALEMMSLLGVAHAFEAVPRSETASDDEGAAESGENGSPAVTKVSPGVSLQLIIGAAALTILVAIALLTRNTALGLILLGGVAGLAIARSGFGVEWSLLAPDSLASSPRFLSQLGLSPVTVRELRSPAALRAMLVAVLLPSATALTIWIAQGFPSSLPAEITDGRGLDIGHVAGAPLLAIGSVLMIGCEFKNYTRLGLGLTTAIASVAGLLVGYVPGAIWGVSIDRWTQSNKILLSSWLPDFISSAPVIWVVIWAMFLLAVIVGIRSVRETVGKKI